MKSSSTRLGVLSSGWLVNPQRHRLSVDPVQMAPTVFGFFKNRVHTRPSDDDFNTGKVIDLAIQKAGLGSVAIEVPDLIWWDKLCRSAKGKANTSNYGRWLLHRKIVHFLAERLSVEETFKHDGKDIFMEKIIDPLFLVGLPRAGNNVVQHVLGRSGIVITPTMKDTLFPSKMSLDTRSAAYRKEMRFFQYNNPEFRVVRDLMGPNQPDDDLNLQLQTPYSIAWGLLHGLDDFLLECLLQPQDGVYAHEKRLLQLFQFYKGMNMLSDAVVRETNPIKNILQEQREGYKETLVYQPFCVHSPLAILNMDSLYASFGKNHAGVLDSAGKPLSAAASSSKELDPTPGKAFNSESDMRLLWCHRNLSEAIGSLCSSLAIHQSLYTGKSPSETQLGTLGEKVCGIFGSGSENAIDFLSTFPKSKLLNVASVDACRSSARISQRVLQFFGHHVDKWRKMQAIEGQTELGAALGRPHHNHKLSLFGLHEGVVAESFDAYCFQFQEYAFLDLKGIEIMEKGLIDQQRAFLNNPGDPTRGLGSGGRESDAKSITTRDGVGPGAKDTAPAHMIGHR